MKKSEREPPEPLKKQNRRFLFPRFVFILFREKKCGTKSKHSKQAKTAKKAKIVESTKNRGRLAEREADSYDQVILGKGQL